MSVVGPTVVSGSMCCNVIRCSIGSGCQQIPKPAVLHMALPAACHKSRGPVVVLVRMCWCILTEQTMCVDPACSTPLRATTLWPSASCWAAAPAWPVRWSAAASHKQCSRVWASLGAQVCVAGRCARDTHQQQVCYIHCIYTDSVSLAAPAARSIWKLATTQLGACIMILLLLC